jgi:class 3 adenylate cyclase/NADH:ubiquinone oxidoreductase subunit C
MADTRQLTTVHRILRVTQTECTALLVKHLFHPEPPVVLSALSFLCESGRTDLCSHYRNLYKKDNQAIRGRILENLTANPEEEAKAFLLETFQQEKSAELRGKILIALGALAEKDVKMRDFLREKVISGGGDTEQRIAAAEGLFISGDYEFLVAEIMKIYHQKEELPILNFLLAKMALCIDSEVFIKLYKFYRNLKDAGEEKDIMLCRAIFGSYKNGRDTALLLSQFREKFLQICRSGNGSELDFAIQVLTDVTFDNSWAVKILSALLVRNDLTRPQEKKREEIFVRMLPEVAQEFSLKKSLNSLVKRLMESCVKLLTERIEKRADLTVEQNKYEFCDFFEALGNKPLLEAVVKYLKGPVSKERQTVILEVLKRVFPSLNNTQKKRMNSVLQLIKTEEGRIRASLVVECSKISFEDSLIRIFARLNFLLQVTVHVMDEHLAKTMHELYQVLGKLLETDRNLRINILIQLFSSSVLKSIENVWNDLMSEFKGEAHGIVEKALNLRTSPLKEEQLVFLKPVFQAEEFDIWQATCSLCLLSSLPELVDGDWSELFIRKLKQMSINERNEPLAESLWFALSKTGTPLAIDFFCDYMRSCKYVLTPQRLQILSNFCCGLRERSDDSAAVLQDMVYACMIESNRFFYADIGFLLCGMKEEYGQVVLIKALESEEKTVVRKTLDYFIALQQKDVWKRIFLLLENGDVVLINVIVKYFAALSDQLNKAELQHLVDSWLNGNVEANAAHEGMDPERIKQILSDMEKSSLTHKSRVGFAQNQQELTVFFIDIAGYTNRCNISSQEEIIEMLKEFTSIVEPIGKKFSGRLIKKIGDCLMYTFTDRVSALLMALEVQSELSRRNDFCVEEEKIHTRIGMNTGEVYLMDNDVFGDAVNLASRVESKAPTDGILVHESTMKGCYDLFVVEKKEPVLVKGIQEPIQTYVVQSAHMGVLEACLKQKDEREI